MNSRALSQRLPDKPTRARALLVAAASAVAAAAVALGWPGSAAAQFMTEFPTPTSPGQLVIWFVNGTSVIGGGSPGGAASPWFVAGTGDFNGDGFGDVLWYNSMTGQVVIWLLNGTSVIGG